MEKTDNKKDELKRILERARTCSSKKRMYVYNMFKQELLDLDLDTYEYNDACIKLARYLKV